MLKTKPDFTNISLLMKIGGHKKIENQSLNISYEKDEKIKNNY